MNELAEWLLLMWMSRLDVRVRMNAEGKSAQEEQLGRCHPGNEERSGT